MGLVNGLKREKIEEMMHEYNCLINNDMLYTKESIVNCYDDFKDLKDYWLHTHKYNEKEVELIVVDVQKCINNQELTESEPFILLESGGESFVFTAYNKIEDVLEKFKEIGLERFIEYESMQDYYVSQSSANRKNKTNEHER